MKKEGQKLTNKDQKYTPNKTELRLLEVILDPFSWIKSVVDVCKMAKISRMTYYEIFKRPEFCALYRNESVKLLRRAAAPMVNALVREACRGNVPAIKIALEILDIYAEKHEVLTESYAERLARLRNPK